MKKHWVPDWLFKGFLIFAIWTFVIAGVVRLVTALSNGRIETRGNHIYSVQDTPNAFTLHISVEIFGLIFLSFFAVASLGFIPRVGRAYRAVITRRFQRLKERRNKR